MGTSSGLAEQRDQPGTSIVATLAAAMKRVCVAYFLRRIEQCESMLRSMSEEELHALGLSRPDNCGRR